MSASIDFLSPTPPTSEPKVPKLSTLCRKLIASKIERFPPEAFAILPEAEWESVVQFRHKSTIPKQAIGTIKGSHDAGLDGTGRKAPAICDKVIRAVEEENPHLSNSKLVDTLIWKDCVNYKFKRGGPSRPKALEHPWPVLVERLQNSGKSLMEALRPDAEKRMEALESTIRVLEESPVNVPLLTESEVGKTVKKFIKTCTKYQQIDKHGGDYPPFFDEFWSPDSRGRFSPLDRLNALLQKWKDVASASGVAVAGKSSSSQDKTPADVQHDQDMRVLQAVLSWRDLHCALTERESKMMANHGAKMRKIRDNLNTKKHQVKKANIRVTSTKGSRHDAILNKSRGLNARMSTVSSAGATTSVSKISMLKKEVATAALRSKGGVGVVKKGPSMFGASVANSCGQKKRKPIENPELAFGKRKEVSMGSGKKMKMPTKKEGGVFSNIQHQLRVKNSRGGGFRR